MRLVALALLLAASTAHARPCDVTIIHAEDDVGAEIMRWVRAEPHCATTLEVRVVPTVGGLYLVAIDGRGRVHDRVVPDAQSAGVLVASWIADTSREPDVVAPPASIEITPPRIELAPPGETPVRTPSRRDHARWVTLGGMTQLRDSAGRGGRAEIDLVTHGPWTLAAGITGSGANLVLASGSDFGFLHTHDVRVVGLLARTSQFGRIGEPSRPDRSNRFQFRRTADLCRRALAPRISRGLGRAPRRSPRRCDRGLRSRDR